MANTTQKNDQRGLVQISERELAELQKMAEATQRRREDSRNRQRRFRSAQKKAGMHAHTLWSHGKAPDGYVPIVVFAAEKIARDISGLGVTPLVYKRSTVKNVTMHGQQATIETWSATINYDVAKIETES